MSQATVKLTGPEAKHVLSLLYERRAEGSYYGNAEEYYARTARIIAKLTTACLRADDVLAPVSEEGE